MTTLSIIGLLSLVVAARLWLFTCDKITGPETKDESFDADGL